MQIFAKTDIGKERKVNEDYYYASKPDEELQLYILADGMGGYNAGEVASSMAVKAAKEYIEKNFKGNNSNNEQIKELLTKAMEYANKVVYEKSINVKEMQGMGTTLEITIIYNNNIYIGHIGDSRVYRIREKAIQKLTKDHSYVQTLIEDGTINEEEAFYHPKRNMLTKALGCTEEAEPDIYVEDIKENDIILISSDGLTNMVRENEVLEIITKEGKNSANALVEKANENGGYDNITVIVIMC